MEVLEDKGRPIQLHTYTTDRLARVASASVWPEAGATAAILLNVIPRAIPRGLRCLYNNVGWQM